MKKILFLSILCSLFFIHHSFAATLNLSASGTTINATLGNVTNTDTYVLVIQKDLFTSDSYTGDASTGLSAEQFDQRKQHSDTATVKTPATLKWSIGGLAAKTTYYVRMADIPPAPGKAMYVTPAQSVITQEANIPFLPLTSKLDGNNVIISGKIDTSKVPDFKAANFSASLVYTATIPAEDATSLSDVFGPIQSHKTQDNTVCDTNAGPCINDDGTYYWYLTNLHPSTTYYFQQTVKVDNKDSKVDTIDRFNSSSGNTIIPGSAEDIADKQSRGYTLLSKGFPGLSFLPDPDLCAQDRAAALAGGKPAPQFCDINDVLNYFLKLLIGISGVILVFRLMYEGFVIMTTDVPFIGAKSKGSFKTALIGLLLALTSYIILNTINPKLVNEEVGIQQLAIGISETSLDSKTFQSVTGETLKTQSQYSTLVDTLSKQQGIDSCIVKATIQAESEWNAGTIGCDEDQPYNIASRKAYLQSGINYNGTTFNPTSNTAASQKNGACKFDASKPGYGLDWRFSKGGGLMQVTLFPAGYKSAAWYAGVKQGGSYWNTRNTPYKGWETLIKPEANITQGIKLLKDSLTDCKGNVEQAFREYQSGSCTASSTLIDATVNKKMSVYNSCKSM